MKNLTTAAQLDLIDAAENTLWEMGLEPDRAEIEEYVFRYQPTSLEEVTEAAAQTQI